MQKQRRFRPRRPIAGDDEDEANGPPAVQLPIRKTDKKRADRQQERRTAEVSTRAGLLSFEGDEDGAPLVSPPARTVKAQAAPAVQEDRTSNTQRSAPGEYSREKLQQLRQQTKSMPGAPPAAKPVDTGGFKLSGSFKAAKKPADDRYEVNASDMMKRAEPRLFKPEAPALPPPPRGAAQRAAAAAAAGPASAAAAPTAPDHDDDDASAFSIPTADAIRRAKEKRERLRSAHLAPDYVPLGGAAALTSNKDAAARLRGDKGSAGAAVSAGGGSDDEREPDADMRMQFVGGNARQSSRASVFAALSAELGTIAGTQEDREEGDEDEDDAWVRQQLQKAGAASYVRTLQQPSSSGTDDRDRSLARAPTQAQAAVDPFAQAAAAGQSVTDLLQQGLQRLHEKQQHVDRQKQQTKANLADSLQAVTQLEGDVAAASQKYTYLQETRGFIADMCDMLQSKSAIVEVLEERLMTAAEVRAEATASAADASDREELEAAQAAIGAAVGVLSGGGAMPEAQRAAEAAAAAADAASLQDLPEALDEFGRDMNVEKRRLAEERLALRTARATGQAAQPAGGTLEEDEADVASYDRERSQILEVAATVFADASEDYSTVEAIKRRLEDWQKSYPAAYRDAYMPLSAPAIFAPFVRLELLHWDPLFGSSATGFESHAWYQQLYEFSAPQDGSAAADEGADVVPVLVRNIIALLALHMAERVWDPASRRQTRGMVAVLENLAEVYLQPDDRNLQEALRAVQKRTADAVGRVAVPRWPGEALAASPRAAAYVARQFRRATALLFAVGTFARVLDPKVVQHLAVEQLLLYQILPLMRSAINDLPRAVELAEQTVAAMPPTWRGKGLPEEAAPFASFVADLGRRAQGSRQSDTSIARRLAQLHKHLPSSDPR